MIILRGYGGGTVIPPPLVNTNNCDYGMKENRHMYNITQHVDYITFTTSEFTPIDDAIGKPEPCRPLIGNYSTAQRYPTGMIVQWHDRIKSLKTHVTMTGETLDSMRVIGFTDAEIVKNLLGMPRANFKRIDLAITSERQDGQEHGFLPKIAHYEALNGKCDTQLTLDKPVVDINLNIETAYIGRRDKREYLRVYDKGLELGGEANKIIRIELERHSTANTIARDVAKEYTYGSIINRYISFPHNEDWLAIVGGTIQTRTRVHIDKERNKEQEIAKLWQWLHNSVAPAYARAMYEDVYEPENNPNIDEFARLIAHHYNKLVDKDMN